MIPILTVKVNFEEDIVLARQRARQIASLLGFDPQEQTRIATAVSEVTRNAFKYAGGGKVEFALVGQAPQSFLTRISDTGPGIPDLPRVLNQPLGSGLVGAQRLMDQVQVESVAGRGTTVHLWKHLPRHLPPLTQPQLGPILERLAAQTPQNPLTEIQQQNQELLRTLAELRQRQEELAQLNRELADTNRGVVALYAELNDKAESLQRASESKTRFLSNLSHEFRTPLNAMLSLTGMLLAGLDGNLNLEQEKQVTFIHQSASALTDLVNDLLDLAKVEAGKVDVRPVPFTVADLFSTLRGMLRPLLVQHPTVNLIFEDPQEIPALETDAGKVSQILRNFIANGLKFTEAGEVRVSARPGPNQTVILAVADTGIGIAAADQGLVFEEFVQVEHPLQQRYRGTGLGLPLCKKLAELLGGRIELQSQPGVGSTFMIILPRVYPGLGEQNLPGSLRFKTNPGADNPRTNSAEMGAIPDPEFTSGFISGNTPANKILIIDDDEISRYTMRRFLNGMPYSVVEAEGGYGGLELARTQQPQVIFLDLLMPDLSGFEVLAALKSDPLTQAIPVIVVTSKSLTAAELEQLAGLTVTILAKQSHSQEQAIAQIRAALGQAGLNFRMEA